MTFVVLDPAVVQPAIIQAWKDHLNTTEDPEGPAEHAGDIKDIPGGPGVFAGLADSAATELSFDSGAQKYTPQSANLDSAISDNSDGTQPKASVSFKKSHGTTISYTRTTTDSISSGFSNSISVSAGIPGVANVKSSFTFHLDFTYSLTESSTTSTTDVSTFSQSVDLTVPKGRIYRTVLEATSQNLVIPYTANVTVTGQSSTAPNSPINGHFFWYMTAGQLFDAIRQYGTIGRDSGLYHSNGDDGIVVMSGSITAQANSDLVMKTYDITDDPHAPLPSAVPLGTSTVPNGKLVMVH